MYPSELIYLMAKNYNKNNRIKSIVNKNDIIMVVITIVLPFILGYIYYMTHAIYSVFWNIEKMRSIKDALVGIPYYYTNYGFSMSGKIYLNYFSNIVLLLPATIYIILKKRRENKFEILTLILCLAYQSILGIEAKRGNVSKYYFAKNYFVIWFILMYLNYKALIILNDKKKILSISILCVYLINIIVMLLIQFKSPDINKKIKINFTEIYNFNAKKVISEEKDLNEDEIEIIKYFNDNLKNKDSIAFITDFTQYLWIYGLTGYESKYIPNNGKGKYNGAKLLRQKWEEEQYIEELPYYKYVICLYRNAHPAIVNSEILNRGKTVFENSAGIIKMFNDN